MILFLGRIKRSVEHILETSLSVSYVFWLLFFLVAVFVNAKLTVMIPFSTREQEIITLWACALYAGMKVSILILVESIFESHFSKFVQLCWKQVASLLLFSSAADLFVYRNLSVHIWTAVRFFFDDGVRQTWEILWASGLLRSTEPWRVLVGATAVLSVLQLARFVSARLSYWYPLFLRVRTVAAVILVALCGIIGEQVFWRRSGALNVWRSRADAISYLHLLGPPKGILSYSARLRSLPLGHGEEDGLIKTASAVSTNTPAILLFVVESLRADVISPEVAPNICRLKGDSLNFTKSFAAANLTHLSWYSLFTGRHALYHRICLSHPVTWGVIPLRVLKRLGYGIHVFSGTRLNYRMRDQMIFGRNLELADTFVDARSTEALDRPEMDDPATGLLLSKIQQLPANGKNLFVMFYESTHHDYYFPPDYAVRFTPFAERWNFAKWDISKEELTRVRNRYFNAIGYVDVLIGRILEYLKRIGLYESTLIILVGDHGEEFLEHGHMTHGTDLNNTQIETPILIKLPKTCQRLNAPHKAIVSHVDVFPTILDCVGAHQNGDSFDGQSIWTETGAPVLIAGGNGGLDPFEFVICDGKYKAYFEYPSQEGKIDVQDRVLLSRIADIEDSSLFETTNEAELRNFVEAHFGTTLHRMYARFH